jgi:hypothetical protein
MERVTTWNVEWVLGSYELWRMSIVLKASTVKLASKHAMSGRVDRNETVIAAEYHEDWSAQVSAMMCFLLVH